MTNPSNAASPVQALAPATQSANAPSAPVRLLNQEERNDLRKRVLAGEQMSLEDAKAVIDTIRQGRGAAALAAESKPKKARSSGSKKPAMTDEAFNNSLDEKLKGL